MFIGNFALGFAAKRLSPAAPLWLLVLAAQLADAVWPIANLFGPPPPPVAAVYMSAMVLFAVVVAWSWWAEKA